jgi:diphosphate-dependent phosphofructokinase
MGPYRKNFHPLIPDLLVDIGSVLFEKRRDCAIEKEIADLFPHLVPCAVLQGASSKMRTEKSPLHIGVFFSGGPAPGGHSVIAGLFDCIKEWHVDSQLIGFVNGPHGILRNPTKELSKADVDGVRNTGGFSLLGSGRTKIETPDQVQKVIERVTSLNLDGLVVIGGDDSNTDAAFLAEAFIQNNVKTCVIGVPKTIDGDLQSEDIPMSFGFDTACKVYSEIIGNIGEDIRSSKKYYFFVRLMGRVASHITLECALATHPNLALISEEVASQSLTLKALVDQITDLVEERAKAKLHYGLILVPEGLVEDIVDVKKLISELNEFFAPTHPLASLLAACSKPGERLDFVLDHISEKSSSCLALFPRHIAEQLLNERDPHGNVQVSRIETERLLMGLVQAEILSRAQKQGKEIPFAAQTCFCGYEGRSAYPSIFDCTYCYALGRLVGIFAIKKMTGFMTALSRLHEPFASWEPLAVPLVSLLHFERRKGAKKAVIQRVLVNLEGKLFSLFKSQRDSWRLADSYLQPGPMQFWGPDELMLSPCISIRLGSS